MAFGAIRFSAARKGAGLDFGPLRSWSESCRVALAKHAIDAFSKEFSELRDIRIICRIEDVRIAAFCRPKQRTAEPIS